MIILQRFKYKSFELSVFNQYLPFAFDKWSKGEETMFNWKWRIDIIWFKLSQTY